MYCTLDQEKILTYPKHLHVNILKYYKTIKTNLPLVGQCSGTVLDQSVGHFLLLIGLRVVVKEASVKKIVSSCSNKRSTPCMEKLYSVHILAI